MPARLTDEQRRARLRAAADRASADLREVYELTERLEPSERDAIGKVRWLLAELRDGERT